MCTGCSGPDPDNGGNRPCLDQCKAEEAIIRREIDPTVQPPTEPTTVELNNW